MVPRKPCEPPAVGRQPCRRKEVVALYQDLSRARSGRAEINGDDRVVRILGCALPVRLRMFFAHADPSVALAVGDGVGISPLDVRWGRPGDRDRYPFTTIPAGGAAKRGWRC